MSINGYSNGAARLETMPPIMPSRSVSQQSYTPHVVSNGSPTANGDRRRSSLSPQSNQHIFATKTVGVQASSPVKSYAKRGPLTDSSSYGRSYLDESDLTRRGSPQTSQYSAPSPTNANDKSAVAGQRRIPGASRPSPASVRQQMKSRQHSRSRIPDSAPVTPQQYEDSSPLSAVNYPIPPPRRYTQPQPYVPSQQPTYRSGSQDPKQQSSMMVSPPAKPPAPREYSPVYANSEPQRMPPDNYDLGPSSYSVEPPTYQPPPRRPPPYHHARRYDPPRHPHHHHHHQHHHQHHPHHYTQNPPPPLNIESRSAPTEGDVVLFNPADPRQAPVLTPQTLEKAHRASYNPPLSAASQLGLPYRPAARQSPPQDGGEYYPVVAARNEPNRAPQGELAQRQERPQPQIPKYILQMLEQRQQSPAQDAPQWRSNNSVNQTPIQQRMVPAAPPYYAPVQQMQPQQQQMYYDEASESLERPNSRLQFRPAAILPQNSPYRPTSRDRNSAAQKSRSGTGKVFPPGLLEMLTQVRNQGYGHYLPAPPEFSVDNHPPMMDMRQEEMIPDTMPEAVPVQPAVDQRLTEFRMPAETPKDDDNSNGSSKLPQHPPNYASDDELVARLQALQGNLGTQSPGNLLIPIENRGDIERPSAPSPQDVAVATEGFSPLEQHAAAPASREEEDEQPNEKEEVVDEEEEHENEREKSSVSSQSSSSSSAKSSSASDSMPTTHQSSQERAHPREVNKEDPETDDEGEESFVVVDPPPQEEVNNQTEDEEGESIRVDGTPQASAKRREEEEPEYEEIDMDLTEFIEDNENIEIMKFPYRKAVEDAFADYIALEGQYVRINEETGEEMEDLVHTVQTKLGGSTPDGRYYISKGLHPEILPLLRYREGEEIPVLDLTFDGFVNICCCLWISRFQPIDAMKDLIAEAKWNTGAVENFNNRGLDLPQRVDGVFSWCVQSIVEADMKEEMKLLEDTGVSSEEIFANKCTQLIDWDNLTCWPVNVWQNTLSDSLGDHTRRFISHCRSSVAEENDVSVTSTAVSRMLTPKEIEARKTWTLFLGASQWDYEESIDAPYRAIPDEVAPLAYSFAARARVYNITGGIGALFFSIITKQLSEACFFEFMFMLEKLHICLSYCNNSSAAQLRDEELGKKSFENVKSVKSTIMASPLWKDHFNSLIDKVGSPRDPNLVGLPSLYSFILHLCSFFPNKEERSLRILAAAVMEDLMQVKIIKNKSRHASFNDMEQADFTIRREGTEAIMLFINQIRELERNAGVILAHSDLVVLTEDEKVNCFLLKTHVPVHTLFKYRYQLNFSRENNDMYPHKQLDVTSYGCKGAFVEAVRSQFISETLQYVLDMEDAILAAVGRDLTEEEALRLVDLKKKMAGIEENQPPNLEDEDELSIASIRSILLCMHEADPQKPISYITEYLRHLLVLYFEEHDVDDFYVDEGSAEEVRTARRTTAVLSLEDWFGEDPINGKRDQLCDKVCVHVQELASLCPRVLTRRWGNINIKREL